MPTPSNYADELLKIKSLLVTSFLEKRPDLKAVQAIAEFNEPLEWLPLEELNITQEAWNYIAGKQIEAKYVFCHPDILIKSPITTLHYRGLSALSQKAAIKRCGSVKNLELGKGKLKKEKALKMATVFNPLICSVIENSDNWTLDDGARTVIATMGITLDGSMRNKTGGLAEERVQTLIVEWLIDNDLIVEPSVSKDDLLDYASLPKTLKLKEGITMKFGSEPDVSFIKVETLIAIIEIKGGVDAAGALERYGAATKSFQHAVDTSHHCKNFLLGGVFTPELTRRIAKDRLVEKTYSFIDILTNPQIRDEFFQELFHHTLRLL